MARRNIKVVLHQNKRLTYTISSALLDGSKNVDELLDLVVVNRDGNEFTKVKGENRFSRGQEVIERGVYDDLEMVKSELSAMLEDEEPVPTPVKVEKPAPQPAPAVQGAADMTAAGAALAMLAQIKEEQVFNKVCADLDHFIFEKYGKLPQKEIVVKSAAGVKPVKGIVHEKFQTVCQFISADVPLYMYGAAGTGKSSIVRQAADVLGMEFYFSGCVSDIYRFTGFVDANGKYQGTQFYDFCVNGGVFFLDEMDASIPEVLVALNSAIANRYFDFPVGRVELNENCRFVAAGNTLGTGADSTYTGRYQLDGATLDRWSTIEIDYSDDVFMAVTENDKSLVELVKSIRKACEFIGANGYVFSYRCAQNAHKMVGVGMGKVDVIKNCIIKGMPKDVVNMVKDKVYASGEWAEAWREI